MSVALVTGASRGIGRAIAIALSPHYDDLLLHASDKSHLADTVDEIHRLSSSTHISAFSADISDEASTDTFIADILRSFTELDLLVLNAGIYADGEGREGLVDAFRSQMRINFEANVQIAAGLLPAILKSTGSRRIIVIGSTAGLEAYPGGADYGTSKWALRGWALNLGRELREDRIGVTYYASGASDTDMWAGEDMPDGKLIDPTDHGALIAAIAALGPTCTVEDVVVRPILGDPH